jgi:hypothetical protein
MQRGFKIRALTFTILPQVRSAKPGEGYSLHFRVCYFFIFPPVPLSLSSFLGAGLDERMQKLLGAHQRRFDGHSEQEHGCFVLQTKLQTIYTFPALEI